MKRSTPEDILYLRGLIERTEDKVRALRSTGKKVHFIWDADHCLVSGRSHDVFKTIVDGDIEKFRIYEDRQFLQVLGCGPWTRFATMRGHLYHSHDLVTARGNMPAYRVMAFCLMRGLMPFRDMMFVGGQSKSGSYEVILGRFKNMPDWHIFLVDDSLEHIADFDAVAEKHGMLDRTYGILSPRIRRYSKEELERHYREVVEGEGPDPYYASTGVTGDDRHFLVVPRPHERMREMFVEEHAEARVDADVTTITEDAKKTFEAIAELKTRGLSDNELNVDERDVSNVIFSDIDSDD